MKLSVNMILDELSEYRPSSYLSDTADWFFSGVRLYDVREQFSPEILYICDLEALQASPPPEDICLLCVLRAQDDERLLSSSVRKQWILIRDTPGVEHVCNRVIALFFKLRDWHMNMHLTLLQHNNVTKILELSESIIGNPIVLVDLRFKLIANTPNIVSDDLIYNDLVSRGYHSSETVERFTAAQTVTHLKHSKQLDVKFPDDITKYQTVTKTFEIERQSYAYLRMICSNREPTPSMLELFELLCESVDHYLHDHYSKDSINHYMYEYVLVDLIENENVDTSTMEERIKYIGLSYQSDYQLLHISFDELHNVSLPYVVEQLMSLFSDSRPFIHDNHIMMLMNYRSKNNSVREIRESQFERLEEFLVRHNAYAGCSNSFTTLHSLRNASVQARTAVEIALQLRERHHTFKPRGSSAKRIFLYDDYYVYHMFSSCSKEVSLESLCTECLLDMMQRDKENGTNWLNILYVYLQHDRKPTEAAKVLHMHRNNVIYHIERIEKHYELNLDDPYLRLRLLLSYKAMDLLTECDE